MSDNKSIEQAGFINVSIEPKSESHELVKDWSELPNLEQLIVSAHIVGSKLV